MIRQPRNDAAARLRWCTACCALLVALALPAHAQQPPDYRLLPGDQLEVSVWGEDDLQRNVLVRPDGRFSFPLAGEIVAYNRTVPEVQEEMTRKLQNYIPEAVVTVTVSEVGGNRVYVIGQVPNPGGLVMNPRLNVLQALSLAGGTTPFASVNDIIILRRGSEGQRLIRFRYNDVARGRDLDQNIMLEAGDVIIVP